MNITPSPFEVQAFIEHITDTSDYHSKMAKAITDNPHLDAFEALNILDEKERQKKRHLINFALRFCFSLDSNYTREAVHTLTEDEYQKELESIVASNRADYYEDLLRKNGSKL